MKSSAWIVVCCIFAAASAFGGILTATSNADSGDGSLRALLAASAADDEIVIPANMTITLESELTLPKWNVTIRGNGKTSIISGNDAVRIFEINYGKTVRYELKDLVLEKGFYADGGAGFKFTSINNSSVVMNDCIVRGMHVTPKSSYEYERGVFMHYGSDTFDFYATNTTFTGCWGGAAVCSIGSNYSKTHRNFVLSKCHIEHNGDTVGHPGYSLINVGFSTEDALIDECVIANNISTNCAAVAYAGSNRSGQHGYLFRKCIITNNVSTTGNSMFNIGFGRTVLRDCVISDNAAAHNVLFSTSTGYGIEFYNCMIERNRTTVVSGDWNCRGLAFVRVVASPLYPETFLLSNCTVRANVSLDGAMFGSYDTTGIMRFVDTLFESNVCWTATLINTTKTNVFTRCAIVDNWQDRASSVGNSSGIIVGAFNFLDNCLVNNNDFIKTRYILSGGMSLVGCTIVSNTCSASYDFPAVEFTASSRGINTVVLGSMKPDRTTIAYDAWFSSSTALTNCYFQKSQKPSADQSVVAGKTLTDLLIDPELTTNGSKTVFLDGTRMPYLSFAKGSPLRNAGVASALLGAKDVRGKSRDSLPDIGCYEYPNPGLNIFVR